ncbi:MAG: hypothetical protein KatS3mg110_4412 [Pirellulaceae bacterium]|nr:MAG: hypothetical protein KatS3mg110_4412 [Pirellulaceae bacterium]
MVRKFSQTAGTTKVSQFAERVFLSKWRRGAVCARRGGRIAWPTNDGGYRGSPRLPRSGVRLASQHQVGTGSGSRLRLWSALTGYFRWTAPFWEMGKMAHIQFTAYAEQALRSLSECRCPIRQWSWGRTGGWVRAMLPMDGRGSNQRRVWWSRFRPMRPGTRGGPDMAAMVRS